MRYLSVCASVCIKDEGTAWQGSLWWRERDIHVCMYTCVCIRDPGDVLTPPGKVHYGSVSAKFVYMCGGGDVLNLP